MISISAKSRYALLALTELARHHDGAPISASELARRREIPVQFLEQLLAVLRRGGLVVSRRGVKGGYVLKRDPAKIDLLEIVEMLDGEVGSGPGADAAPWAEIVASLREQLATRTLNQLVDDEAAASGGPMYYI